MALMCPKEGTVRAYPHLAARQTDKLLACLVLLAYPKRFHLLLLLLLLDLLLCLGEPVLEVRHPIGRSVGRFLFFCGYCRRLSWELRSWHSCGIFSSEAWWRYRRDIWEKLGQRILRCLCHYKILVFSRVVGLHGFDLPLDVLLEHFENGKVFWQLAQVIEVAFDSNPAKQ